ncbi:MAG TPA: cupin domain-containing protein [Candidatus Acidoferrales bacterium]|nr:cupin domain-containing protein [Candidatus Acidoferrales bacterium]
MTTSNVVQLKDATIQNTDFRRVLVTGAHSQLVVMSVLPGEDIGDEVHEVDQILYVVDGQGQASLDGQSTAFEAGAMIWVPASTRHNIINTGQKPLRLFTVYAPPEHADGTVHATRADADKAEAAEAALHDISAVPEPGP